MELRAYLIILWRRKWVITLTTAVAVIVAAVGGLLLTPNYKASTALRIATSTGGPVDYGDTVYAERLMRTYAEIVTSGPVLDATIQEFDISQTPEINVEILSETEVLEITVEHHDPVLAAEVANFLAKFLVDQSKRIRDFRSNPVSVVGPATIPKEPSNPGLKLTIVLGVMAGLAGGLGLAFLVENLDTRLYTTEQIERATQTLVLGEIPFVAKRQQNTFLNGVSPQGEAFRRLRTNIFAQGFRRLPKTLVVTSAEPGEGKSTIVANLAYALVQSGQTVIVVDGDLRRPVLHKLFNLPNKIGLNNILKQEATLAEAVQESGVGANVLTSGPLPPNPAELLDSPQMTALIKQMAEQFDMVLLDSPALVPVVDAAILASLVDATLLIVGRAQVQEKVVLAARRQLDHVNVKPIGVVINRAEQISSYKYYAEPGRISAHSKVFNRDKPEHAPTLKK